MFPLLEREQPNPLELFQIWLNLPSEDKLVEPHFAMLWDHDVPRCTFVDGEERRTEVTVIAGRLDDRRAPAPPPRSWAARPDTDVAIWSIRMAAGGRWTVPPAADARTNRALYFFRGPSLRVAGEGLSSNAAAIVRSDAAVALEAGDGECEILLL